MIYIDTKTFQCYTTQNDEGSRILHDDPFFDGKCQTFIEGYCCVPVGYNWTGSDGTVYPGGMTFPWKDINVLEDAQRQYEREKLADAENALAILLGGGV